MMNNKNVNWKFFEYKEYFEEVALYKKHRILGLTISWGTEGTGILLHKSHFECV